MKLFKSRSFLLIALFLFCNFGLSENIKILAQNYDNSIQLTSSALKEWLAVNENQNYYDQKSQIESYFIQQALLSSQTDLPPILKNKIDFYYLLDQYNAIKSYQINKISNEFTVNNNELNKQVIKLEDNQKQQTHKVRLYQIFKRYPANSTEEDKREVLATMKTIRKNINSLDEFKKSAVIESNSQSRLQKGLIGNVRKGMFDPSIEKVVMQMKKDQLSQAIAIPNGVVLFYCEKVIQPKIISPQQLKKMATRNLKSQYVTREWDALKQNARQQLNITYNWELIKNNNKEDSTVINTLLDQLTFQQLKWLLNPYHQNINVNEFSNEQITQVVEDYFIHKSLFAQLAIKHRSGIIKKLKNHYVDRLISEILIMLVKPKIKEPTLQNITNYYKINQTDFIGPKKYDISAIAFNYDQKSRVKQYKKMETIFQNLSKNQLTFESAEQAHSVILKRFPNMNLHRIAKKRMTKIFGMRVTNMIINMPIGKISDVIELKSGYLCILRLNAVLDPELIPLNDSKEFIIDKLKNLQVEKIQKNIMDNIVEQQKIKYF